MDELSLLGLHVAASLLSHGLFDGGKELIRKFRENPNVGRLVDNALEDVRNYEHLKSYIPLDCTETIYSTERSPLKDKVNEFLKSNIPNLLLLGDSGGGKSLFCAKLSLQLIEEYKRDHNNAPLPLLILLGKWASEVKHGQLIEAILKDDFGLPPKDIAALRKEKKFVFILDGYDELGFKEKEDIYTTNKLNNWGNARVIFTSRTHYLEKSEDYNIFYKKEPLANFRDLKSLKILYIAPYSTEQVESYLQEYAPDTWLICKNKINAIYNLKELASNPLLLYIITKTILSPIENEETEEIFTRPTLYQGFFGQWFEREVNRLRIAFDRELFFEFAEELAFEMFLEGKMEIKSPKKSLFRQNQAQLNSLLELFTSEDIQYVRARSGCPIKRTADNTYRFMHKSFQEFCVARKLCREINENNLKNLNKKLLTAEPAIIEFLSEMVKR